MPAEQIFAIVGQERDRNGSAERRAGSWTERAGWAGRKSEEGRQTTKGAAGGDRLSHTHKNRQRNSQDRGIDANMFSLGSACKRQTRGADAPLTVGLLRVGDVFQVAADLRYRKW